MQKQPYNKNKKTAGRIATVLALGWVGLFLFSALTVPVAAGPISRNTAIVGTHMEQQERDSYLEVYDLRGQLLFEMQGRLSDPGVIDQSRRLPAGVYLVRVLTPDARGHLSVSVKKIVVLR